jgi:hypothetical protein
MQIRSASERRATGSARVRQWTVMVPAVLTVLTCTLLGTVGCFIKL